MSNKQSKRIRKLTKGFSKAQIRNVKEKYNKLSSTQKGDVLSKLEQLNKTNHEAK